MSRENLETALNLISPPSLDRQQGPAINMPALYAPLERAVEMAPRLIKRSALSVNHTQAVTLGVMAVYVVIIALLWNLPYVRWSLWPFKVNDTHPRIFPGGLV